MENLKRFLNELEFFKGLDESYIDLLTGCAENMRFPAGSYLFQEGEKAAKFYVIRSGRVTMQEPVPGFGSITIQTLEKGDITGWSWLFPPHFARINARSEMDTRVLVFDGECLRNKCEENHELGYEFMKRFAHIVIKRLEATRLQLLEVCMQPDNLVM